MLPSCDIHEKSDTKIPETDPLVSWHSSKAKTAIIDFVASVTDKNSNSFVPLAERIAVFDNDGTLWSEQPAYFQLFFAIDRIKALSKDHPEWKEIQPYKAVLENDWDVVYPLELKSE